MAALPEDERPIVGTKGVLKRRQRLQQQLPSHDAYAEKAVSIATDEARRELERYVKKAQEVGETTIAIACARSRRFQSVAIARVVPTSVDGRIVESPSSSPSPVPAPSSLPLACSRCDGALEPNSVAIRPSRVHAAHNNGGGSRRSRLIIDPSLQLGIRAACKSREAGGRADENRLSASATSVTSFLSIFSTFSSRDAFCAAATSPRLNINAARAATSSSLTSNTRALKRNLGI